MGTPRTGACPWRRSLAGGATWGGASQRCIYGRDEAAFAVAAR